MNREPIDCRRRKRRRKAEAEGKGPKQSSHNVSYNRPEGCPMSTREEIMHLEECLRQAELGPDPSFFEEHLADNAVLDALKPFGVTHLNAPFTPSRIWAVMQEHKAQ